ncbi:hypothetical protein [Streptomyces canus]|uniref:hypothetical protein n=1 Tax=Streptomyces canus TaxID=58343 RepID=UPI0022501535|nr:hypothetical protein [Streptomyces canus]MCX4852850.1 hypothetical protein [Streptomyces canus]
MAACCCSPADERHGRLDEGHWKAVEIAVRAIADRRRQPDAGIRELSDRLWTHSRLSCVAGVRAVAAAAPRRPLGDPCTALADALLDAVERTCLHPDSHWQRTPDDPSVDTALLLPGVRGALPATDPRTRAASSRAAANWPTTTSATASATTSVPWKRPRVPSCCAGS